MPAFNAGQALQSLFGGKSASVGAPPTNPNQQPQNQREYQQSQVRGQAPTGENTQLEGQTASNVEMNEDGTPKAAELPLDKFKDLWQAPTDADGKPVAAKQKKSYSLDAAKVMEYAGKQDFRKFIKPETLAAIQKGGEEGTAAFAQAMQDIGSSTFATTMTAASRLMDQAMSASRAEFEESIPDLVRKHSMKDNLRTKNPVTSHPAAAPIISALQSQLATKYPDATAAELGDMATEFLTTFATEVSGKKAKDATEEGGKRGQKQEQDWSQFA